MMVIVEHGDAPQSDSPKRAVRHHRTPHEVRELLLKAAWRFAWSWRLQRLTLIIAWFALIALTVLTTLDLIEITYARVLDGVMILIAWGLLFGLSFLHVGSTDGLIDRILKHRLCLTCGHSLLHEELDEAQSGYCPSCRRRFTLAEYASPTACLEALRAVRLKLHDRLHGETLPDEQLEKIKAELKQFHPAVYESPQHYEQVMAASARRLIWSTRPLLGVRYAILGAVLPMTAGTMLFSWLVVTGNYPVWTATALLFIVPLAAVGMAWLTIRDAMKSRILDHHLCLKCGTPLKSVPLNPRGVGECPKCYRIFHTREYLPPRTDEYTPNWRDIRLALYHWKDGDFLLESPTPNIIGEDGPRKALDESPVEESAVTRCPQCNYILNGLPVNDDGEGACRECSMIFWKADDTVSTANESIMALKRIRKKRRANAEHDEKWE